ncbi:MAG: putative quinol monooxygenase [Burkholderiales bacterium]
MSEQISWHVELQVKPGQIDALRVLTREMIESTKRESGVLIYERFMSDDGQVVHLLERYVDSTAAAAHLVAFERQYGERFASMVDRKRFTVFGTPSVELMQILDRFGARYVASFAGFSNI